MLTQAGQDDSSASPRHSPVRRPVAVTLLQSGKVSADDMLQALAARGREAAPLHDLLRARGLVEDADIRAALAQSWGLQQLALADDPPDPRLIATMGAVTCLRLGLVPWRRAGDVTVVAISRPQDFARLRPQLEAQLGPVCAALAPARDIVEAIHAFGGPDLAQAAESRVPLGESCRGWPRLYHAPRMMTCLVLAVILILVAPVASAFLLVCCSLVSLVLIVALKLAATVAALTQMPTPAPVFAKDDDPVVSIIVALYRESDIAGRLVRRLARLDYPEQLLDVILAVEASDQLTRTALDAAQLPGWMRVVVVPEGKVKTKPRALNHALEHARGSIVGVYDAEDAPEADQIRKVVAQFRAAGPDVACLQGVLDYYNPRTNWLSRCFTIEYAGWFRLILPGIARLGLVVPLGGTTLFFRREVLEALGGWDAHNVTEDADLGIRLARHGYRTALVDTVTGEEANCRVIPWIKQRSRWIKGYIVTWAVHMRDPQLLWRQLGPRAFLGVQIMFLGTIAQFLLAPLMWTLLLVPFGVGHPVLAALPPAMFWAMASAFILSEAANLAIGIIGLSRTRHRLSWIWVPTMKLYFPLATLAAYKALIELVTRPFYWDKTTHGLFDQVADHRG